jgi:hypothetical protein
MQRVDAMVEAEAAETILAIDAACCTETDGLTRHPL